LWQAIREFPSLPLLERNQEENREDEATLQALLEISRKITDLQHKIRQQTANGDAFPHPEGPERLRFPHRHFHPPRSPPPGQPESHAGSDTAVESQGSSESENEQLRAREDEEYDRNFDAHDYYPNNND
jgi:hypothetical protein